METEESVLEQFKQLTVTPSATVLSKCLSICTNHTISAEELVNQWMAFSLSNSLDSEPTIDSLQLLERKVLMKNLNVTPAKQKTNLKVYQSTPKLVSDDISVAYGSLEETPKNGRVGKRELGSPDEGVNKRRQATENTLRDSFGSCSFSSKISQQSTKYNERLDSRSVQFSLGDKNLLTGLTWKGGANTDFSFNVKDDCYIKPFSYMYETLLEKAETVLPHIERIASELLQKHKLRPPVPIDQKLMEPGIVYGRICSNTSSGRLTATELYLEGVLASKEALNKRIKVDLKVLEDYWLFRGQVIVAEATHPFAGTLRPNKVFTEAEAPCPQKPIQLNAPLEIIVASGPYTLADNFTYEPLADFVRYVIEFKPDIVIMLGPFVDETQDLIANGMLAESFDELFEKLIAGMMEPIKNLKTQVILVPSFRDAHHHPVYPTPPFQLEKLYPKLHLVTDPCQLDINGLIIGLTSVDVLTHLGNSEICRFQSAPTNIVRQDRMSRLASYVICQRSLYPLLPTLTDVPLDYFYWNKLSNFDETPHIIVLPSKMKHFVKIVKSCVVINPEVLGKGQQGGTFARIHIPAMNSTGPITKNIACQIIKI